jgi:hypothetical protein
MEEAGSGHEVDHNIPTSDALQVLSRSQVALSCQCPCGYGRYVKDLHTYIHIPVCQARAVAQLGFHCLMARELQPTTICMSIDPAQQTGRLYNRTVVAAEAGIQ